jgi:putative ABC transport system permease protein
MVLLVGSGLLIRSLQALHGSDPGFDPEGILALQLDLSSETYPNEASISLYFEEVVRSVESIPGVLWAGFWGPGRPLQAFRLQSTVPEGTLLTDYSEATVSRLHAVDPGEMEQLGIRLVRGREISAEDRPESPLVALISESLAEKLWPSEDPIGRRFGPFVPPGADPGSMPRYEVVGIVADAHLGGRVTPSGFISVGYDFFLANSQLPQRNAALLVKTDGDPSALADEVRIALREVDDGVPLYNVWPLADDLAREEGPARFAAVLMALFGTLALFLASLGVYGMLSYSVALRTREVGVRAALGADVTQNLRLFVGQGIKLAVAGIALGLGCGLLLARLIASVLYAVQPTDALSLSVAALVLLVAALVASYVPARRAAVADPVQALREG